MDISKILLLAVACAFILGGCALLSRYLDKRAQKKGESGSWAAQKTPLIVTIGTTFATAFGGGMLTYHVGLGYQYGWSVLWYGICQGGGIFTVILIAKWLRKHEFKSIPEIFTKLYGKSNVMTAVIAIVAMVTPFGWVASQCVAFAKVFSTLTGISIPVLTIIFALVTLAFVWPNGYGTVAWSDAIFGFCIAAICIVACISGVGMAGGWSNVVAAEPELSRFGSSIMTAGPAMIAYWFMSVYPGQLTNQMYIQRAAASDTQKNALRALAIAGFMVFAGDIFSAYMGRAIFALNPNLAAESAFGWYLTQLSPVLMFLIMGLVGASIMSTCDSAVQSAVVSVVYDLYGKLINPTADEKQLKKMSRIFSVIVIALAVTIGLAFPVVMDLITVSYSYSVALLLFPIYAGYYLRQKKFATRQGVYISMVCGVLGNLYGQFIYTGTVPFAMFGLIGSAVGLVLGSLVTREKFYKDFVEVED